MVDDCSPEPFPDTDGVTVVRRETNGGFGAAVNSGAAVADPALLLVLNSDVALTADFVDDLFAAAAAVDAGGGRPPTTSTPRAPVEQRAGTSPPSATRWSSGSPRWRGSETGGSARGGRPRHPRVPGAILPVDWVVGAALLLPTEAFRAVGGFDEGFFMNSEEVDLQRRLREHGMPSVFLGTVPLTHAGGGSTDPPAPAPLAGGSRLRYAARGGRGAGCRLARRGHPSTRRRTPGAACRPSRRPGPTAREELGSSTVERPMNVSRRLVEAPPRSVARRPRAAPASTVGLSPPSGPGPSSSARCAAWRRPISIGAGCAVLRGCWLQAEGPTGSDHDRRPRLLRSRRPRALPSTPSRSAATGLRRRCLHRTTDHGRADRAAGAAPDRSASATGVPGPAGRGPRRRHHRRRRHGRRARRRHPRRPGRGDRRRRAGPVSPDPVATVTVLVTGGAGFIGQHLARRLTGCTTSRPTTCSPPGPRRPRGRPRAASPGRSWSATSPTPRLDRRPAQVAGRRRGPPRGRDRHRAVDVRARPLPPGQRRGHPAGRGVRRGSGSPARDELARRLRQRPLRVRRPRAPLRRPLLCRSAPAGSSREDDPHRPVSVYGETKSLGERCARRVRARGGHRRSARRTSSDPARRCTTRTRVCSPPSSPAPRSGQPHDVRRREPDPRLRPRLRRRPPGPLGVDTPASRGAVRCVNSGTGVRTSLRRARRATPRRPRRPRRVASRTSRCTAPATSSTRAPT